MNEERLRLFRAQAEQKEWEFSELHRSLLPCAGVLHAWQRLRAAFSAICLAISPKLSARLAAIQDREEAQAVLTAAVRQALQKCSEYDLPDGEPPAGANGKFRPRARAIPIH